METFLATVSQIVPESDEVRTFRLALPDGAELGFAPGQFVEVGLPGPERRLRAYSIASSPLEKGHVEITVENHGDVPRQLFALRGGERVLVSPPLGKWRFRDEFRRVSMISRGTGIAPFRSMIRYVLDKGLPTRLKLFYAERTPGRLLYRGELDDYRRAGVEVYVTMTEPDSAEEGETWAGPTGPLTLPVLREQGADLAEDHFLLCGSGKLIDSLLPGLRRGGVDEDRLHVEKWGNF